jgi:hypothetical protein
MSAALMTPEQYAEAMARICCLCHAAPDRRCRNICTGIALPPGECHMARLGGK